jgi:hypothetical protein
MDCRVKPGNDEHGRFLGYCGPAAPKGEADGLDGMRRGTLRLTRAGLP